MIFKFLFLAIFSLTSRVYTASPSSADQTFSQLLDKLLESFKQQPNNSPKPWHLREAEESSPQPRMKPVPAPPPSPALGSVDLPVAWPYPPAPTQGGKSEFPLLDMFMKSNGMQNNNQINVGNQWNEQIVERMPTPTASPIQWDIQKSAEVQAPSSFRWGIPKSREAPTLVPAHVPQYIEWGVPHKPQPAPHSGVVVPPPLNPEENFFIQHNRDSQGQPKHFSLETFRASEPETENKDKKLNVSFIMPPDIRPLSLNFDTGEVQINFGDEKGRRVPIPATALPDAKQYRSQLQLDQIFGTQVPKKAQVQSQTNSPSKDEDDEYIVVRHDMNKYAYDLPKGLSVGTNPQLSHGSQTQQPSAQNGNSQTQKIEKYDVSGQKNLHFVLGRVSG